jgi:hypothetical protein
MIRGHSDLGTAISLAIPAAGLKYFVGIVASEKDAGSERQLQSYRSFIKNALVWSGPTVFPVNDTRQLDEGLAFGTVINATVGFDVYNSDTKTVSSGNIVAELLPSEVYGYLGHVKELEKIDRSIKLVAERIGPGDDDNLLHDLRTIILRDVFALTKSDRDAFEAEFSAALQVLLLKAHKTPPVRSLLAATKATYERLDSRRIEIGDWQVMSSWIKAKPPRTFDDLLSGKGLPIPIPPEDVFRTYDG